MTLSVSSQYSQFIKIIQQSHILIITVLMIFSLSCQQVDLSQHSPWALAEHIIGQSLSSEEFDLNQVKDQLSPKALKQLKILQQSHLIDQNLGLLSVNKNRVGGWNGFFGYQRHQWPLLLQFELKSEQIGSKISWKINQLPFFSAYQQLAELTDRSSISSKREKQLPWIQNALSWQGGLTGRDVRGRPLSNVVVVWLPPLAFVDGIPLSGIASRTQLSRKISQAFEQRRRLAEEAQASYTPHVSLAFPRTTPAIQVAELMAWVEGVGTEQISLLVHSENGPGLVYLNPRVERTTLINPQRLLHAKLQSQKGHLYVERTDQAKAEAIKGEVDLHLQEKHDFPKLDRATRSFYALIDQVRSKGHLNGLVIHLEHHSTVSDLIRMIDVCQRVDPELAITLAPHPTVSEP